MASVVGGGAIVVADEHCVAVLVVAVVVVFDDAGPSSSVSIVVTSDDCFNGGWCERFPFLVVVVLTGVGVPVGGVEREGLILGVVGDGDDRRKSRIPTSLPCRPTVISGKNAAATVLPVAKVMVCRWGHMVPQSSHYQLID